MVKKKLTKSARVRALLEAGKKTEYTNGKRKIAVEKVGGNPVPDFLTARIPSGSDTFAAWIASQPKDDPINPDHYKRNGIEAVDVIEAFDLNYRLGNVVKYVLRHVGKNGLEDLKKAQWYLNREISKHE